MKLLRPLLLYFSFALVAFTILAIWASNGKHAINGDEPSYLTGARSLFVYHDINQYKALIDERNTKDICPICNNNFEANYIKGQLENEYFDPHGLGLSVIMALPYAAGGIVGSRIMMVAIIAFITCLTWSISARFGCTPMIRGLITVALAFAMPFLPAAGQIYPDLLGGLIGLAVISYLLGRSRRRPISLEIGLSLCVASLIWLHIRFAPTAVIALIAIVYLAQDRRRTGLIFLIPFACSVVLFLIYSNHVYGSPFGQFGRGQLELSWHSMMVLIGLFIDQNQGMFFQNPLLLVGLFFLPLLFFEDWKIALLTVVLFASLILPTALHPVWYGGWSFSGRFEWAALTVFMIPTIFGLSWLAEKFRAGFYVLIAAGIGLQLYFFYIYSFVAIYLFNHSNFSLAQYSVYFNDISRFLPALYDLQFAPTHVANYVFALVVLAIFACGIAYACFGQANAFRMKRSVRIRSA